MPDFDYQQSVTPQQLYELLLSRNFEIEILDSSGQRITDPATAEVLSFDYKTANKNYGTVVILLSNEKTLEMFYSDNLGRSMELKDKNSWYDFLYQIRMFAKRNLLSFELKNMNKLKYTMQGMAALKESYYGNKKTSYSDGPQKTRLIINHNKQLEANDPRYRYIESIFVETADGERFKLPFTKLTAGRAMARHVSEGGRPYDDIGQHICSTVEHINKLGKFVRKLGNRELTAESDLAKSAHDEYDTSRRLLKSLASKRGYQKFKESWSPAEPGSTEAVVESITQALIAESYSNSNKGKALMKEIKLFESWANRLTEGKWALPNSPEAISTLADLMSDYLTVGADASNAQELLYDILGDDELFDQLSDLAWQDPEADARPVVIAWLQAHQNDDPSLAQAMQAIAGGQQVDEEIGDPTDDPEFYGDDDDDDEAVQSEFYVAIYNEGENTTFVGGIRQSDRRWEEFVVGGEKPDNWGYNGYMSYLTANDVMEWIHKDYRRGYEVAGPFWSRQQAIQHATQEFGPMESTNEDFHNEYGANQHFSGKRKLPNKQFTDFNEWRTFMSAFDPAVRFVKKVLPTGEIILAKDGDRVLGSFSPANKFGFIGESADNVDEGWKEKVAGAAIGLAALGGVAAGIANSPMAHLNGQQIQMAVPGHIPDTAKLVTDDSGKKIYVWRSHAAKHSPGYANGMLVYRPADDKVSEAVSTEVKHTPAKLRTDESAVNALSLLLKKIL